MSGLFFYGWINDANREFDEQQESMEIGFVLCRIFLMSFCLESEKPDVLLRRFC